ncbi:MAG TPA: TRAP transporter substrate-binding protein [Candidatus Dormibacteraeota bacterium]|jgi:tripartite ATP-independent transporter DctP family solute receptor|nr:TRAP transporter substrate-binding protein [Candidatus Dormibacteraeota bacterium]
MPRRLALAASLWVVAVLGATSTASAQAPALTPQFVWKAGTATAGGNPLNDAMELFAKQLAERSRGRIKLDVHIANALAKGEGAHLEGVQLGAIDVVAIGSAPVGGMFEPLYQALDLPFLWSTREQVWKVMDGPLGQELLKKMESKNLKAFCFGGGWGFRNMMVNKRPIVTPEDMKGLTIRVQESPTYVAMMKAMGANPVPMAYVEVYLAMKQGTIDGMELPSFTFTSDKFQEVTKYYSLTRHSYPPIAWFMNLKKYQALPADIQKIVDESMRDACQAHRRLEVEKEKNDFEVMRKAGVQINDVKDIKAFQALMKPAYDYVEGQVGKEFMTRLRAAVQAASK